jgi:hypothetical protein
MGHCKGKYNARKTADACLRLWRFKSTAVHWHRKALEIDPALQRSAQMLKSLTP